MPAGFPGEQSLAIILNNRTTGIALLFYFCSEVPCGTDDSRKQAPENGTIQSKNRRQGKVRRVKRAEAGIKKNTPMKAVMDKKKKSGYIPA